LITKAILRNHLEQNGYTRAVDGAYSNGTFRYEVSDDHYRLFRRDASKRWYLVEVTTFVDLFLDESYILKDKWHFILGKQLSDVPVDLPLQNT